MVSQAWFTIPNMEELTSIRSKKTHQASHAQLHRSSTPDETELIDDIGAAPCNPDLLLRRSQLGFLRAPSVSWLGAQDLRSGTQHKLPVGFFHILSTVGIHCSTSLVVRMGAVLRMPQGDYRVQRIYDQNQTVLLVDDLLTDNPCPQSAHNLIVQNSFPGLP